MPVSFRCLKLGQRLLVRDVSLSGSSGGRMFSCLLRQFWITERTCGQLVTATGQHRLELRSRTSPSRLANWQQASTRDGGYPAKTQQPQAEPVAPARHGLSAVRQPSQGAPVRMSAAHRLRRPGPALLLAVTFRHVLRECAHPRDGFTRMACDQLLLVIDLKQVSPAWSSSC